MAPLAFQAFLLVVLFLPGAAALYTFGGKLTPGNQLPNLSLAPTHRAVMALIVALLLHGIWLSIVHGLHLAGWQYRPDAKVILQLLAGSPTLPGYAAALEKFGANWWPMTVYFTTILVGGGFAGYLLRGLLRKLKLDRRFPVLRFEHPWHYALSAEMADFPEYADQFPDSTVAVWVAAAVDIAGEAYLYQGLLEAWWMTPDGRLDRLMLSSVARTPLPVTQAEADKPNWVLLPSHFFMLEYAQILSLGLNYLSLQPSHATGGGALPAVEGAGTATQGPAPKE